MMMMWNCWNHSSSLSSIHQWVTVTPSTRSITRSAAMIPSILPIPRTEQELAVEVADVMVSISMTSIFNPLSARSFSSSHPSPPAPRTKTCSRPSAPTLCLPVRSQACRWAATHEHVVKVRPAPYDVAAMVPLDRLHVNAWALHLSARGRTVATLKLKLRSVPGNSKSRSTDTWQRAARTRDPREASSWRGCTYPSGGSHE